MNLSTLLIASLLAAAFAAVIKGAGKKKHSCCEGCASCGGHPHAGGCHHDALSSDKGEIVHAIDPFKIKVSADSGRAAET